MRLLLLLLAACLPVSPDGPLLGALSVEAPGVVRVATWNLETVGEAGSDEYEHALAMLDRLRPDVLAVNEIGSRADRDHFDHFAADAGYPYVAVAEVGFGSDRNGVLSRFPIEVESLNGASVSGDPEANDLTRDFLHVGVELPSGQNLTVVSMHWKSGSSGGFRRAVESHRAAQVADSAGPILLMGDLNVDLDDGPVGPEHYDFLPSGLPAAYQLGSDLATNLEQGGLRNAPFSLLFEAGLEAVPATQLSGESTTRPVSGRRLDYLLTSPGVHWIGHEVFDCADEDLEGGRPKFGGALTEEVCDEAADHLPVFLDLVLPIEAELLEPGDLRIQELMANPADCSDRTGEWVEIQNTSQATFALDGLVLRDAAGNEGRISSTQLIFPGDRAVLVRGTTPCGPTNDGTFGRLVSLNNAGDTLTLSNGAGELDVVTYPRAGGTAGLSWSVDGDTGCVTTPTPGLPNEACER